MTEREFRRLPKVLVCTHRNREETTESSAFHPHAGMRYNWWCPDCDIRVRRLTEVSLDGGKTWEDFADGVRWGGSLDDPSSI